MNSTAHAEETPNQRSAGLGLMWPRVILAVFFCFGGVMHIVRPAPYEAIIPPSLPSPPLLVLVSGICEILGGLGVLLPATRRIAGWGLIALLIAVFPANIQMLHLAYLNGASPLWKAMLWFRLPLQLPLLWWVWRAAARPAR